MVKKMNPEVKALWLSALRSGEYQQAKEALKTRVEEVSPWKHCCLGVLCELAQKQGLVEFNETTQTFYNVNNLMDVGSSFLPEVVQRWANITRAGDYDDDSCSNHTLSLQNDAGKCFAEIADIIEEKF